MKFESSHDVVKDEQNILHEHLVNGTIVEPPSGFTILAEEVSPSMRLVRWKLRTVSKRAAVYRSELTGNRYFTIASYISCSSGSWVIHSVEALYRNGKMKRS